MRYRSVISHIPISIQPMAPGYNTAFIEPSRSNSPNPEFPPAPGWRESVVLGRIYMSTIMMGKAKILYIADMRARFRSEEHTSELQSLMRISYAVLCLKKKKMLQ